MVDEELLRNTLLDCQRQAGRLLKQYSDEDDETAWARSLGISETVNLLAVTLGWNDERYAEALAEGFSG